MPKIIKKLLKKTAGFTLMEMIVAVGIFALITGLVLANFRQGQKEEDLKRGALEMVSNIRKVQTLGMSGQIVNVCVGGNNNGQRCDSDADCGSPSTCESIVPEGGFGISIKPVRGSDTQIFCNEPSSDIECPTTYTLFADLNNDDEDYLGGYDEGTGRDLPLAGAENYAFPRNAHILDYDIQCTWQGYPSPCPLPWQYGLDVTFRPPKPTPYTFVPVGDEVQAYAEYTVKILIQHSDCEKCREVTINGISGDVNDVVNESCELPNKPW